MNVNAGGVNVNLGVTLGGGTSNPSGSTSMGSTATPSSPAGNGGAGSDTPTSGPPAFSRQVDASAVSGTVRVKPAGAKSFVALSGTVRLATGSQIDTTLGAVRVVSPRAKDGGWQSAVFADALFKVIQKRQAKPITDVALTGGDFSVCRATARRLRTASAAKRKRAVRKVRGSGHGRFRTRGRYGSASVRGTIWVTEDRCDGTLVAVKRGRVAVRDFVRHKTVVVRAGNSYFARARS